MQLKSTDSLVGFCYLSFSFLCAKLEEGTLNKEEPSKVGQTQSQMLIIVNDWNSDQQL